MANHKQLLATCCFLLLTGLAWPCYSLVINRIDAVPQGFARGNNTSVVNNGLLYYVDGRLNLFVSDGTADGTRQLTDNVAPVRFNPAGLVVADGVIYFIRDEAGSRTGISDEFHLWRTDGTPAGTSRALTLDLPISNTSTSLISLGDSLLLPVISEEGFNGMFFVTDLAITDGTPEGTVIIDAERPLLNSVCVIDENNFYYQDSVNRPNNEHRIFHYADGVVENVSVGSTRYEFIFSSLSRNIDDHCIYLINDRATGMRQIAALSSDGEATIIEVPNARSDNQDTGLLSYEVQGKLYLARATPGSGSFGIPSSTILFQYIPGQSELLENDLLDTPGVFGSRIDILHISRNNFYVTFGGSAIDTFFPTLVLNSDLERVSVIDPFSSATNPFISEVRSALFSGTIINNAGEDLYFNPDNQQLLRLDNDNATRLIRSYDLNIENFLRLASATGDSLFVTATNLDSNLSGLYELTDTINVSERLEGLWSNPDFSRSGMNITETVSPDGLTRHLSLSLLSFSDGLPFWLFGAAVIRDGNTSVIFDMSFSTGREFLQPNPPQTGQRIAAGTATLTVTGCDEINIVFDLIQPFGQRDIDFFRLFDSAVAPLCNDAVNLQGVTD